MGRPLRRSTLCASVRDIEDEIEAARRSGIRFVALCEPEYPAPLRAIDSAPPVIAVRGRLDILVRPMVAIVGSRNASAAGLVMTERLAQGIGGAGHPVVSGLARGIDARAHLASLPTGTVAVLAGGHGRIYPSDHAGLAARIAESGAVVSEMPLAWEARARDFPRRNRIVSGLSFGVVVVEAARRSGSLITACFANEQGREVFAVPGSPLDPRAEGTNDLLRQGATLCTSAADVLDALRPVMAEGIGALGRGLETRGPERDGFWDELDLEGQVDDAAPQDPRSPPPDDALERIRPASTWGPGELKTRIGALVGAAPVSVDDLVRVVELPARSVQAALIELELEGSIVRHGAGLVARAVVLP